MFACIHSKRQMCPTNIGLCVHVLTENVHTVLSEMGNEISYVQKLRRRPSPDVILINTSMMTNSFNI